MADTALQEARERIRGAIRDAGVGLIGELSLGGEVRSVPGILSMAAALARHGVDRVIVASA